MILYWNQTHQLLILSFTFYYEWKASKNLVYSIIFLQKCEQHIKWRFYFIYINDSLYVFIEVFDFYKTRIAK